MLSATLFTYVLVFLLSLFFYSSDLGGRAIYSGPAAVVIDMLAIVAGVYTIRFAHDSYLMGVDLVWVMMTVAIGSVVSAMHLAKWLVRFLIRGRSVG